MESVINILLLLQKAESNLPAKRQVAVEQEQLYEEEMGSVLLHRTQGKGYACHQNETVMKECNVKCHFILVDPKQVSLPDNKKKAEFGCLSSQLEKQSAFMETRCKLLMRATLGSDSMLHIMWPPMSSGLLLMISYKSA